MCSKSRVSVYQGTETSVEKSVEEVVEVSS